MMLRKIAIAVILCLFMPALVFAQQRGTPAEAKNMVVDAVAFIKANGTAQAIQEINNPKGKFVKGDLYVFAFNSKGVMVAHPNAQLIGQNFSERPDEKGKLFTQEIIHLANTQGSGWVDYHWLNPELNQLEAKITYFETIANLIVCCGAYLP